MSPRYEVHHRTGEAVARLDVYEIVDTERPRRPMASDLLRDDAEKIVAALNESASHRLADKV